MANGTAACHQGLLLMVGQAILCNHCVQVESVQAVWRVSLVPRPMVQLHVIRGCC
jgi:hypothetical protein